MTYYTNPGESYMYGNQEADPLLGTNIVTDLSAYNRSGGTEGVISLAPGATPYFGLGESAESFTGGLAPGSGMFISADPEEISRYKSFSNRYMLQEAAKEAAKGAAIASAGLALSGGFAGAGAGAGAGTAAPWTGELTAAGLPTGAGIAAAPLTGGLGTLGATTAATLPIGLEEILVTGSRVPLGTLPDLGIAALSATPTLLNMPSGTPSDQVYPEQGPPEPSDQVYPEQGPPEPESQTWWDKLKGKLPDALVDKVKDYFTNPLVTGLAGLLAGKYLGDQGGSSTRTPQKYPYYKAGKYDWRTGSFAPGKWQDEYPMADGGFIPVSSSNYPLGRVQADGLGGYDTLINPYTGQERPRANFAAGGIASLGTYSDGGRLLRGPGDGISDNIPAVIQGKNIQPARLADGEFVIPARIVSEIGNGSTEAGARKLYQIMDAIQRDRSKTTSKGRVAKNTRAERHFLNRK
jgi:hypothetical protein